MAVDGDACVDGIVTKIEDFVNNLCHIGHGLFIFDLKISLNPKLV